MDKLKGVLRGFNEDKQGKKGNWQALGYCKAGKMSSSFFNSLSK